MCAAAGEFGVFHFQFFHFQLPYVLLVLISSGDSFYDIRGQSEIDLYFILLKASFGQNLVPLPLGVQVLKVWKTSQLQHLDVWDRCRQ